MVTFALSTLHAESEIGRAKKNARREIRTWTLVPKIDLALTSVYNVHPDGTPTDQDQGDQYYRPGTQIGQKRLHREVACMETGRTYRKLEKMSGMVFLDFEVNGDTIQLIFFDCVKFKIRHEAKVTAADLSPERIAGALAGFFRITGPNLPGQSLRARIRETGATSSSLSARSEPARSFARLAPSIGNLVVAVVPSRVARGETAELVLRFEILGPTGELAVSESRTLSLDGEVLPNYPNQRQSERARGAHETVLRQAIPASASPGVYRLKGEVCVAEDCRSRTARFEVLP